METAKNSRGLVISGEGMTLAQALSRRWTCATCREDVPVYPTKWPCPHCTRDHRDAECRHPHFYWKTREEEPHREPCPRSSDAVAATVEERVVRSRRGVPGHGPGAIRFDLPDRLQVNGGDGVASDGRGGFRHVRKGGVQRRRADHRVTTTEIAPACRFFIGHPDDRDRPLSVPDVPEWADRYWKVFKNLGRAEDLTGRTHIWWSRVQAMRMPDHAGAVLSLPMTGGRRILVDRQGWGRAAATFDRRLASVFAEAVKAMRRKEAGTWINVLAFGFGQLDDDGAVRVRDARKFHALVEVSER